MATLTTTQTSPSLRGDYRRHHYWRRDVFSACGHVRGVVLLVNGGADLYLVLYAAFRLDDSGS